MVGDVVVDVVFERGLFHLELANLGSRPALDVRCRFEPELHDLHGRSVGELPLFAHLPFLMPGKRIRTLLDSGGAYFARAKRTSLRVTITYRDDSGERRSVVEHDLAVYRDVAYTP